jgi:hypothetical protein
VVTYKKGNQRGVTVSINTAPNQYLDYNLTSYSGRKGINDVAWIISKIEPVLEMLNY